jgi:hypothetical protein
MARNDAAGPGSQCLVGGRGLWDQRARAGRPRPARSRFIHLRFVHPRSGSAQEPCGPPAPDNGLWAYACDGWSMGPGGGVRRAATTFLACAPMVRGLVDWPKSAIFASATGRLPTYLAAHSGIIHAGHERASRFVVARRWFLARGLVARSDFIHWAMDGGCASRFVVAPSSIR